MRLHVLSFILLTIFVSTGCQSEKSAPGVLARVNERVITLEDFNRKYEEMKLENQFSPGGHDALMKMRKEFLGQLIDEILVLQTAKRQGISVTDEELERQIMDTKGDYKGESLRDYLHNQGISFETWRERVQERLLIEKTIRENCHDQKPIGNDEARAYYDEHRDEYVVPERVKARQIVIASHRKATTILGKLKEGAVFEELAVENSLGPEGRFGGDLGYFARGDMPEEFNVAFTMKTGQISDPVESPYGYHIFKLEDKRPEQQLAFDEVVDDIKRKIAQRKSEECYYQWLEELRGNAKIEINAHLLEYAH